MFFVTKVQLPAVTITSAMHTKLFTCSYFFCIYVYFIVNKAQKFIDCNNNFENITKHCQGKKRKKDCRI